MAQKTYGERVLDSLMVQCERRGIPLEESGSVMAHIAEETGTPVMEMSLVQLRRLEQNLDTYFRGYLDGQKRRGAVDGAWPDGATPAAVMAAAEAGIAIGEIEGTGADGQVIKDDVAKAVERRQSDSE